VRGKGSAEPRSRAENQNQFLPSFWHVWSWGRGLLIPDCYSKWKLASEKDSKCNSWKGTIINLPEDKIEEFFVRGQGDDHCFLVLWGSDYGGHDVATEDSQLRRLHQDADRTQEALQTSPVSQEPNRILASAWQCKAAHSLKIRNTITKFGWTVLPQPHYSPDLAPSDFHLFGARRMQSAVWSFSCLYCT